MIYRTSKSEIALYREEDALSQSDLKKLLGGMDNFMKEDSEKQSLPMIIGSAVDTILTGAEGEFEEEFHIISIPKPSETIENILLSVYEMSDNKNAPLPDMLDFVQEAILAYNYQANWKMETRVSKIMEHFIYYEEIKKCAGKIVLSPADMEVINNVVDSLRTNPVTKDLFSDTRNNTDFYYQLPLFWEKDGVKCKGLLDLVIVKKNAEGKVTSVIPFDLKTLYDSTLNFNEAMKKRRYDIQAAWYYYGLGYNLLAKTLSFEADLSCLVNFNFVVESTTNPGRPLWYFCTDNLMKIGRYGLPEVTVNNRIIRKEILGFEQLLNLYRYYQTQGWQEEQAIYESQGRLELDWDFTAYQQKENENTIWKKI